MARALSTLAESIPLYWIASKQAFFSFNYFNTTQNTHITQLV